MRLIGTAARTIAVGLSADDAERAFHAACRAFDFPESDDESFLPMNSIFTEAAPKPAGHYSQAVVHGGIVYVAGQLPIDPKSGKPVLGTIEEQTTLALANVEAILKAAGSSLDRVLRCTVYVSEIALWPQVNATYAKAFGAHKPARTVVPCKELHYGCLVEIDAVAACG